MGWFLFLRVASRDDASVLHCVPSKGTWYMHVCQMRCRYANACQPRDVEPGTAAVGSARELDTIR